VFSDEATIGTVGGGAARYARRLSRRHESPRLLRQGRDDPGGQNGPPRRGDATVRGQALLRAPVWEDAPAASTGSRAALWADRLNRSYVLASRIGEALRDGDDDEDEDSSEDSGAALLRGLLEEEGDGEAPEHGVRQRLARHLPFDLGVARLHRGTAAAQAARRLGARAFTIGRDVFFGEGEFDPHSQKGLGLIAHELTHVGQQTGAGGQADAGDAGAADFVGGLRDRYDALSHGGHPDFGERIGGGALARATGIANRLLHQGEEAERPSMAFVLPPPRGGGAEGPEPSQTATEAGGATASGRKMPPQAKNVDARAVADRVYELMKQELVLARLRGGLGRHGG
jgi:hypothetical protein